MRMDIQRCDICGKEGKLIRHQRTVFNWFRIRKINVLYRTNPNGSFNIENKNWLSDEDLDICSIRCFNRLLTRIMKD